MTERDGGGITEMKNNKMMIGIEGKLKYWWEYVWTKTELSQQ